MNSLHFIMNPGLVPLWPTISVNEKVGQPCPSLQVLEFIAHDVDVILQIAKLSVAGLKNEGRVAYVSLSLLVSRLAAT